MSGGTTEVNVARDTIQKEGNARVHLRYVLHLMGNRPFRLRPSGVISWSRTHSANIGNQRDSEESALPDDTKCPQDWFGDVTTSSRFMPH